jgi:hypothetical protein
MFCLTLDYFAKIYNLTLRHPKHHFIIVEKQIVKDGRIDISVVSIPTLGRKLESKIVLASLLTMAEKMKTVLKSWLLFALLHKYFSKLLVIQTMKK